MKRFKFSKNRKFVKYCPCGRSNKDGKFAPIGGHTNCGYCHSCDKYFPLGAGTIVEPSDIIDKKEIPLPPTYYSLELVEKTVLDNSISNFIKFLRTIFPDDIIIETINKYLIGTWDGDKVIFWELDQQGKVYHGKVMGYDPKTGKRSYLENGDADITSMRCCLKLWKFKDDRCLYGLHTINKDTCIVALVEGAKTAFIMRMLKPEYKWLATGDKGRFNYKFLKAIKHCKIEVFPDKGEYADWSQKAIELNKKGFNIEVHDLLENMDYPKGTDLADICIDLRTKEFLQNWQPKNDWDFSEGSREVFRMVQERKMIRLELTKEESYKAIQFFSDNNTDIYRL
ncbi:DUF6371 domain-containing protein [Flavobacterium sp.]|uniref:DUF6371 domain-containing protein n=1 Tax=Flavobacterium sp. TaxID=239 RepID=UPI002C265E37|nr:DUF6371 domain-containing protein [Flavobacterium sp.]HSD06515.1 DUF6371 domain-containing protein [Flavobacterium sp.]